MVSLRGMQRLFLHIAYDGTNYSGWQTQKRVPTVQETIEDTLSRLYDTPIKVEGCGRTDAGVHASSYYLHYDAPRDRDPLVFILNKMLPDDIAVRSVHEVPADAHARFSAEWRSYTYHLHEGKDPFRRLHSLEVPLSKWRRSDCAEAVKLFRRGEYFRHFCRASPKEKHYLSTIRSVDLVFDEEGTARFEITANRYLHNMIRRLVGCLVDLSKGNIDLNQIEAALFHDRPMSFSYCAPPQGLFLSRVTYPFLPA